MTDTELEIMLRLPSIMRWQVVQLRRTQSVAEHSYRVWLLATHLYDTLWGVPHNSFERDLVQRYALLHDVDEVITGDIPSTVKRMLEEIAPGVMRKFSNRVMVDLPQASAAHSGIEGTPAEVYVKIADNVEAILYLREYGMGNVSSIIASRDMDIARWLQRGIDNFGEVDWQTVQLWIATRKEHQHG